MRESEFLDALRLSLGTRPELRLFRQSSGVAWAPLTEHGRQVLTALARAGDMQRVQMGPADGCADLTGMACGSGVRLEVEVKSDKGRLRPEQERWRDWVMGNGGVWYLAKPLRDEQLQAATERCASELLQLIAAKEKVNG